MPRITCSNDAFRLLSEYWKDDSEYIERFYVLLLNQANKVIAISMISQGGISGTVADPRVIFTVALKTAAAAIILAHNHPSGNCKPSDADIKLTHKMQNAGSFLDIPVLDHVIIGDGNYYSFADEGII
ncbi:MAG: JAB domain-containing protein [Bacteroidales bacterium]